MNILKKSWLFCSFALLTLTVNITCGNAENKESSEQGETSELSKNTDVSTEESTDIKEEQPFKPINASFVDGDKNVVELSELRGKVVFINMWATWCPPCIEEMPALNRLYDKYKDEENIEFLFVEVDDDYKKAEDFLVKNKYTLPLYSIKGDLPMEMASNAIPTTIIIDGRGEINIKHLGAADYDDPEIHKHIDNLLHK